MLKLRQKMMSYGTDNLDIFKNRLGWEAEPGGGWAPIEENPPRSLPGRQIVSHLSSSLSKETNTNINTYKHINKYKLNSRLLFLGFCIATLQKRNIGISGSCVKSF